MKKIICLFMILLSCISYIMIFNQEHTYVKNEIDRFEEKERYSYKVVLPTSINNIQKEEVLEKLIDVLDYSNGNIVYTRIVGDKEECNKYIYLSDFNLLEKVSYKGQTFRNKEDMLSDKYLSSVKSNDKNQIGVIETFSDEDIINIYSIERMSNDNFLLGGYCSISFEDKEGIKLFEDQFESEFNGEKIQLITDNYEVNKSNTNYIVIGCIYFAILVLIIYDVIKQYKCIGIQKMMGYSIKDIWLERIRKLIILQVGTFLLSSVILSIIKFSEYNCYFIRLVVKVGIIFIIEILLTFIICSLPYLLSKRIKIVNIIKNKKPTKAIIIFNCIIKTLLIIIMAYTIISGINNYRRIKNVLVNSYSEWEKLEDYYVIPGLYNVSQEVLANENFKKNLKNIYLEYNKMGAVYAEFSECISTSQEYGEDLKYLNDNIEINPNYLLKYKILDEDNNRVKIDEESTDYILLVPEKYKKDEKKIKEQYDIYRNSSIESPPEGQEVKIIWTKNNQKYFSMLMDVNPNDNNCFEDPIAFILTEKNGVTSDYMCIGRQYSPLKIKVTDSNFPNATIDPILEKYGCKSYVQEISSANQDVVSEIKNMRETLTYLSIEICFMSLGIVTIIIQNTYCYFEHCKHKIAVRKLLGYKVIEKYKESFIVSIINWVVIGILLLIATLSNKKVIGLICVYGFIFEMIVMLLCLKIIEKKRIVSVIKGEE